MLVKDVQIRMHDGCSFKWQIIGALYLWKCVETANVYVVDLIGYKHIWTILRRWILYDCTSMVVHILIVSIELYGL